MIISTSTQNWQSEQLSVVASAYLNESEISYGTNCLFGERLC